MRGLEQIPGLYDALMAVADRLGFRRWRRWVTEGATGRVLEVGCGTGRNLPLYPGGVRLVALEPSLHVIEASRRRAGGVPLVVARAEALPFAGDSFDTVVSSLVFCSVEEPERGLDEIRRTLAQGGELRMIEHVRSRHRLAAGWQDLVQPLWTALAGGCRPNRRTEATVEAAGFAIDPAGRRARGTLRRFVARPRA